MRKRNKQVITQDTRYTWFLKRGTLRGKERDDSPSNVKKRNKEPVTNSIEATIWEEETKGLNLGSPENSLFIGKY